MAHPPSPYAQAMLDYWHGKADAAYTIHRDDGFQHTVPAAASFVGQPFSPLEQIALERATGRIADTGAGVGRHALHLQERGCQVTAIEIEPALATIMAGRGVVDPVSGSIFSLDGRQFDTILMLMNGFGLVGTSAGADMFFEQARRLLSRTGQILCDSLDVRRTTNPVHLTYQQANLRRGDPAGQMRFLIEYQGRRGETFDWLHVDFPTMREISAKHGFSAEMIAQEENGHYLARLACDPTQAA